MKKVISSMILIMVSVMVVSAQTGQEEKVSKEEIKQFASAFQQVQTVSQLAHQEMVKTVEGEGLEVQRYNEIQQGQQDPNQEVNATDGQLKQYQAAAQQLEEIQVQAQHEIQDKIIEEGLTLNRYQEIVAIVQNSPELQQKVQEHIQG